jgi:amino acid transporter
MKKINRLLLTGMTYLTAYTSVIAQPPPDSEVQVDQNALNFSIPTIGDILTFVIRAFFVVAGIMALLYLLLGALSWITSGGDKGNVEKARDKIQAAIVGVLMIVIVLAIVWTLEQVVFQRRVCFGISCPLELPALLAP